MVLVAVRQESGCVRVFLRFLGHVWTSWSGTRAVSWVLGFWLAKVSQEQELNRFQSLKPKPATGVRESGPVAALACLGFRGGLPPTTQSPARKNKVWVGAMLGL